MGIVVLIAVMILVGLLIGGSQASSGRTTAPTAREATTSGPSPRPW